MLRKRTRTKVVESNLPEACDNLVHYLFSTCEGWDGSKQFEGTSERLVRMYKEFCWSPAEIKVALDKQFRVFESSYDEMLVTGPITVWVLCPHHLLPCEFKVTIGYIPEVDGKGKGKVLGLSKFARIAYIMGRRPIMQEQYTTELAEELNSRLQPKGVAVHVRGHHGCMQSRGVRQESAVITSVIKGVFEQTPTRGEFYSNVEANK